MTVPAGGEAAFRVRVAADGDQLAVDGQEIMWFVSAEHQSTGKRLRMPMYYRAVAPELLEAAAPDPGDPTGVEEPEASPCPLDTDGSFSLAWSYVPPTQTAPEPIGFRIQQGTFSTPIFSDDAAEPLVAGVNSKWTGSVQWTSQIDPQTASLAYFVPDLAEQDEALTLEPGVLVPAGGASLGFTTDQDTEEGFDFFFVEASKDGGPFQTLGVFSGVYLGRRGFDLSPFAGGEVRIRFRMQSDLVASAPGVYVDDVEITVDDFEAVADVGAGAVSHPVTVASAGEHLFRVLGLFDTPTGTAPGPASETTCVAVELACAADVVLSSQSFSSDQVVTACQTLTAAPDVVIEAPAAVVFQAGRRIALGDGFRVESGARFTARIDPGLDP